MLTRAYAPLLLSIVPRYKSANYAHSVISTMNFIVIALTLALFEADVKGFESNVGRNTDSYLDTMQVIRKYGYPAEAHTVKTTDGYLLTMHRIPTGKQHFRQESDNSESRKPPILLQHGLLGSSMDFLIIASKKALPFLLADSGYDVWLGNVRGNTYSRAHAALFPNEKEFWNFSWHQSGVHDLPAQIDFICNHTKEEKLVYVGYSMGTTMFFVMTSTLPQYNDKIMLSLLLAPVAYVQNIKSPLLRFLAPFSEEFKVINDLIRSGEFLPGGKLLKILAKIFCEKTNVEKSLCMNAIFLIVGKDPKEFDQNLLSVLINHYPNGYSAKGVNHYSQLVQSGKFRQYDYGKNGNILQYGSPTPPDYDFNAITTPMYFYAGRNDFLATPQDVKRLAKELPSLKKLHLVDYPSFSHLDFLMSIDVKKLVYDVLINDLISFSNNHQ